MKDFLKIRPFSLLLTILLAWSLLNFEVGTYVGIFGIILYFVGRFVFKNEKEKYFPITTLLIIFFIQIYAFYARLNLLPAETTSGSMDGALGAAYLLMAYVVVAPFLSIFPTFQLTKVNKWFLLSILPSAIIAAYWYFYLYSIVGNY